MLLRRIARPLLAGIFIHSGLGALRETKSHAQAAEPVLDKLGEFAPTDRLPSSTTMVTVDAWTKIGAGTLLTLGKFPRFASTALAASLIPTTLAGHRFWELDDPQERSEQQIHFLKNLGLLGGLAIAASDTHGKPSLAWRGRRAGRLAAAASQRRLAKVAAAADRTGGKVVRFGEEGAGKAVSMGHGVVGAITEAADEVSGRVKSLSR